MARQPSFAENAKAIREGLALCQRHPMIQPLPRFHLLLDSRAKELAPGTWLAVECDPPVSGGLAIARVPVVAGRLPPVVGEGPTLRVWASLRRRAAPEEWAYVFSRVCLHAVMGHIDPARRDLAWHQAAWVIADDFAVAARVGRRPAEMPPPPAGLPRRDERQLATFLAENPVPEEVAGLSLGRAGEPFWTFTGSFVLSDMLRQQLMAAFARGVRAAAAAAVDVAGGARRTIGAARSVETLVKRARDWMIAEYPLLASLASSFTLIEDAELCQAMRVSVAAICDATQEIYVNPKVGFAGEEARFVIAHELLHTGLRHIPRRQGREPWLWNIACDYVINDWLIEMQVGAPPERLGYLHDPALRGLSAEEVYDRIVRDLRWMRRLRKARTLNGNEPDMLEGDRPSGWWAGGGVDLDAFYRRCLTEGLELHQGRGRGLLPAGLIEEIRALSQPPIPWDVALAHWLDQYFPPIERRRSYARASRRQSSTPDIPRPSWVSPSDVVASRVFGAVIDTSGSMDRADLGKAIGAIANYGMSRDVGFVRLIECDAVAHDAGYVEPSSLLDRVRVRGRGGTVLMPGIRLLEEARDFPRDGPILVITDAACDRLTIRREHAYLIAGGRSLPFPARGPIFRMA